MRPDGLQNRCVGEAVLVRWWGLVLMLPVRSILILSTHSGLCLHPSLPNGAILLSIGPVPGVHIGTFAAFTQLFIECAGQGSAWNATFPQHSPTNIGSRDIAYSRSTSLNSLDRANVPWTMDDRINRTANQNLRCPKCQTSFLAQSASVCPAVVSVSALRRTPTRLILDGVGAGADHDNDNDTKPRVHS